MKNAKVFLLAAVMTAVLTTTASASLLTMNLEAQDGKGNAFDVFVEDNGALDTNPLTGVVSFTGTVRNLTGTFSVTGSDAGGFPSYTFAGDFSDTIETGLIAFASFSGLGPLNPDAAVYDHHFTATSDTQISAGALGFINSAPVWDNFNNLGPMITYISSSNSADPLNFEGVNGNVITTQPSSFGQIVSFGLSQNSHSTFESTFTVEHVPDGGSTLSLVALSALLICGFRRQILS